MRPLPYKVVVTSTSSVPNHGTCAHFRQGPGWWSCEHGVVETARVDRWMWAVRLFRTRAESAAACRGGHVRIDGRPAKAASPVAPGTTVEVRAHDVDRTVEVVRPIEKRVGASVAADCMVDHTPPPSPRDLTPPVAERERGAGRPTKRERREIDRLRGRRR